MCARRLRRPCWLSTSSSINFSALDLITSSLETFRVSNRLTTTQTISKSSDDTSGLGVSRCWTRVSWRILHTYQISIEGKSIFPRRNRTIKLTPNLVPPLGFPLRSLLAPEPSWSSRVSWLPSCFRTLEVIIFL